VLQFQIINLDDDMFGGLRREPGSKKSLTSTLYVDKANNWAEP
jgi:hypothetical protein